MNLLRREKYEYFYDRRRPIFYSICSTQPTANSRVREIENKNKNVDRLTRVKWEFKCSKAFSLRFSLFSFLFFTRFVCSYESINSFTEIEQFMHRMLVAFAWMSILYSTKQTTIAQLKRKTKTKKKKRREKRTKISCFTWSDTFYRAKSWMHCISLDAFFIHLIKAAFNCISVIHKWIDNASAWTQYDFTKKLLANELNDREGGGALVRTTHCEQAKKKQNEKQKSISKFRSSWKNLSLALSIVFDRAEITTRENPKQKLKWKTNRSSSLHVFCNLKSH